MNQKIPDKFSNDVRILLDKARLIAMELGYNYISSIHLFVADCELSQPHSIRDFVFSSEADFKIFLESIRIGPLSIFTQDQNGEFLLDDSLPLTKEAEEVITNSFSVAKKYKSKEIKPCHFFLSAVELQDSVFYQVINKKAGLRERMINYYIENGAIGERPDGFLKKLFFTRL